MGLAVIFHLNFTNVGMQISGNLHTYVSKIREFTNVGMQISGNLHTYVSKSVRSSELLLLFSILNTNKNNWFKILYERSLSG